MNTDNIVSVVESLGASKETISTVKRLISEKYDSLIIWRVIFGFGLTVFLLPVVSKIMQHDSFNDDRSAGLICFWGGVFIMGLSRSRIERGKLRKSVIDIVERFSNRVAEGVTGSSGNTTED